METNVVAILPFHSKMNKDKFVIQLKIKESSLSTENTDKVGT